MKSLSRIVPVLAAFLCGQGFAQEVRKPPATTVAAIPELAHNQVPSELAPPTEKPDFQIESTLTKRIKVVEPSPISGLPPVEGTVKLTVHGVANPRLSESAAPAVASITALDESGSIEQDEEQQETHFASISATVYDRSRTLLECQPMDGSGQSVAVWSNIDFNHFCGVGNFEAKGADGQVRHYHLMMGIGNEESAQLAEDPEGPQIPTLPDGPPAFVVFTENPDPAAVRMVEDLHALYRAEGARMAADVAAREKAEQERREYLLAHPPKPKDVTVHFWQRNTAAETQTPEGGQP
jgi:hypothetical protein